MADMITYLFRFDDRDWSLTCKPHVAKRISEKYGVELTIGNDEHVRQDRRFDAKYMRKWLEWHLSIHFFPINK